MILALCGAFFISPAQAQILCGQHDEVVAKLKQNYGEIPVQIGMGNDGRVIEVLSAESGSFTIISTSPDGLSCLIAAGENWERLAKRKPPET